MIPYLHLEAIKFGLLVLHVWGFFVAAGAAAAIFLGKKMTRRRGLNENFFINASFWIFLAALVGARLFHVFFYDWPYFRTNLIEIAAFWQGGLSSVGGFLGAAVAIFLIFRRRFSEFWSYGDIFAFVFPLGWGIGRLGCFFTHLHPGKLTNFFLAVRFPDGPRHELGFYEALLGFLIFGLFLFLARQPRRNGFYVLVLIFVYSIPRFFLDFLRAEDLPASDTRYLGLTPAQYAMIVLVGIGALIFTRYKRRMTTAG